MMCIVINIQINYQILVYQLLVFRSYLIKIFKNNIHFIAMKKMKLKNG